MVISKEKIKAMHYNEFADYIVEKLVKDGSSTSVDFYECYDEEVEEAEWVWKVGRVEFADGEYIMSGYYGGDARVFICEIEDCRESIECFKSGFVTFLRGMECSTVFVEV